MATFWSHWTEQDRPALSEEFKSFVGSCLQYDPTKRPSAAEALYHPWFMLETATQDEIAKECEERKIRIQQQKMSLKGQKW